MRYEYCSDQHSSAIALQLFALGLHEVHLSWMIQHFCAAILCAPTSLSDRWAVRLTYCLCYFNGDP